MIGTIRAARGFSRTTTLALLACAMLLRVLIPQGWMPVRTDAGWRLTICTGSGPVTIAMPHRMAGMHHAPSGQDHAPGEHVCAYSSLAMAIDEPVLPAIVLPRLMLAIWRATTGRSIAIGRGLAAPLPPATGPPRV